MNNCTCGCGPGVGHGHHEPGCGSDPRRDRLENLGARLEIAMAKALLREADRDALVKAGSFMSRYRNALGDLAVGPKPLDPEDV